MSDQNQLRWLPSFRSLSSEQQEVVSLPNTGSAILYGPAGCGKTAMILHRAKVLHDIGRTFIIFAYTNVLVQFVRAAAPDLGFSEEAITSFYSWVWHTHKQLIGPPPDGDNSKYDCWVKNLINHFENYPNQIPHYDYILIDEAQDFSQDVSRLMRMLSSNVFIAGDVAQSLYIDNVEMDDFLHNWGPTDRFKKLVKNYRNPKTIAQVAALYLKGGSISAQQFLDQVVGHPSEKKPVCYEIETLDQQVDKIVKIIEQARGAISIGIICLRSKQVQEMRIRLSQKRITTYVAQSGGYYDFTRLSVPVLTTYHSAKGLEFDTVILPYLDCDHWDDFPELKSNRLFFVGLTRAKKEVYLLYKKGRASRQVNQLLNGNRDLIQIPTANIHSVTTSHFQSSADDLPF